MFRNRVKRLHFIGIGGIGMSGIAEVLCTLGYDVQGSDLQANANTERLKGLGVAICLGHDGAHVAQADVVVTSSAVPPDNPEVKEARRRQIPVIRRAEMLAELMRLKYGIAVAGTHGKTTTTSLIAAILTHAHMDPTAVIGGQVKSMGSNARLGAGEYLIAEADESDGSFLRLVPTLAVVTNIDLEHTDFYAGGLDSIRQAFADFLAKVPFYGASVLCHDHPVVQSLLPTLGTRYITYGFAPQATLTADDVQLASTSTSFNVHCEGERLGRVHVNLIGRHNVQNALAAIAVALEVGVSFAVAAEALAQFAGVARRFEVKGERAGVLLVDDYGHHPVEVKATLRAAREAYPGRRLVVAFQPHRFTRTRDFFDEFARAFNDCHLLFVSDTYPAGEAPIPGADAASLCQQILACGHRHVVHAGSLAGLEQALAEAVEPGDLVLTLGAGNVWRVGEPLLTALEGRRPAVTADP